MNRENIETKLGEPISEEDYHLFIEPFEGISRLEVIRASLNRDEIINPPKVAASKSRIVDFPENLPFKDAASFKAVHKLLATLVNSSLGLQDTDTFAQQHKLENQKVHLLRFLLILGNHGKFEKAKLVVEAKTYLANRGKEKT